MIYTGKLTIDATEEERLDNIMEEEISCQRRYLEALDYKLSNSEVTGNRKKEVLKSMISLLIEKL